MTIEEDRSEVERIAVSWQDVPELEQEAMLARLGAMLEYLDPTEDAEVPTPTGHRAVDAEDRSKPGTLRR